MSLFGLMKINEPNIVSAEVLCKTLILNSWNTPFKCYTLFRNRCKLLRNVKRNCPSFPCTSNSAENNLKLLFLILWPKPVTFKEYFEKQRTFFYTSHSQEFRYCITTGYSWHKNTQVKLSHTPVVNFTKIQKLTKTPFICNVQSNQLTMVRRG